MKYLLLLFVAFGGIFTTGAQLQPPPQAREPAPVEQPQPQGVIFKYTDYPAMFKGSVESWISRNMLLPDSIREGNMEGQTVIRFIVTDSGKVKDPHIVSSSGSAVLDKEAMRLANAMPDWIPARNGEMPVNSYTTQIFNAPGPVGPTAPPVTDAIPRNPDEPYKYVERMPVFKGDITEWIHNNLRYPGKAKTNGVEGRTYIQFVVTETGQITGAKLLRSSGSPDLDNEALRLVQAMPAWTPGSNDGVLVKCYVAQPFTFSLE